MDSPPVPLPRVKSPPWHMKSVMTRWNDEFLKCNGFPEAPVPFSPVHNARKFSAVFGTTSARNVISIRPADAPPIEISKNTTGFPILNQLSGTTTPPTHLSNRRCSFFSSLSFRTPSLSVCRRELVFFVAIICTLVGVFFATCRRRRSEFKPTRYYCRQVAAYWGTEVSRITEQQRMSS